MGLLDKAKQLLGKHDDKVDQALDKVGEEVKRRAPGHDAQIDQGVDKLQTMTGAGDTTQRPPEAAPPGAPPEGTDPPPRT
jgi:hypothetical protein